MTDPLDPPQTLKVHTGSVAPMLSGPLTPLTPVFVFLLGLGLAASAGFYLGINRTTSLLVFSIGTLLSALLALLLRQQATDRQRTEARTNADLEELQLQKYALDQHAIVATTDAQGKIIYVNDKFCHISGYSHGELIGQDHAMVNSGIHPHGFFKAMYRLLATGKT